MHSPVRSICGRGFGSQLRRRPNNLVARLGTVAPERLNSVTANQGTPAVEGRCVFKMATVRPMDGFGLRRRWGSLSPERWELAGEM